jgi:1-acyl-sn-glycerol-3-phosphate acyltransferase
MMGHPIPAVFRAFDALFLPWMSRHIAGVHITGLPKPHELTRPLILVANHVSWWDGFLLRRVQRFLRPHAPMHTVMLERELSKWPILRLLGGIGIDPDHPTSVVQSIRVLEGRLERRRDSVVLYFPQGMIWPSQKRPLAFHRGIELFAEKLPPADILPIAIHLEPMNTPAPHAFIAADRPVSATSVTRTDLEIAVERQLDAIGALLTGHGEDSLAAWPEIHDSLPTPIRPRRAMLSLG